MIKPKIGACIDCKDGIDKPLIAGRCQSHYWAHRRKVSSEKTSTKDIVAASIKKPNNASSLVLWYSKIMREEVPVCWECGRKIDKSNTLAWHGSIAHILPKAYFPSVKAHPMNYLILGMYCCHGIYDSSWDNASEMRIFETAKIRFNEFKSELTKAELSRKSLSYFLT